MSNHLITDATRGHLAALLPSLPTRRSTEPRDLWPPILGKPLVAWFAICVPYALLILGNLWDLQLLHGEMNSAQRALGYLCLGLPVLAIAGASTWAWVSNMRGNRFGCSIALIVWAVGSAYLGFVLAVQQQIVPESIPHWMFNSGDFVSRQFCFGMIPVMFALCRLALVGKPLPILFSLVLGISAGIGCVFAFISLSVIGAISSGFASIAFGVVAFVGSSMMVAAMIRFSMDCYAAVRSTSAVGIGLLMGVLCIVLPFAGLALNAMIPFPADFQSPGVWILAGVNGLVLSLPAFRHAMLHRAVWLAQCACFPFTLYFFLVFVPVIPLAPLALLVFGAGFLILVPSMLFAVHVWRICDGWLEGKQHSHGLALAIGGLVAASLLPLSLALEAHRDKQTLDRAISYFHSPKFEVGSRFSGNTNQAARLLTKIHQLRHGAHLPLIDDYYRRVVFGGLVLPQKLVEKLHQDLTGEALPASPTANFLPWGQRSRGTMEEVATLPPNPDMLKSAALQTIPTSAHTAESKLMITFENPMNVNAEFSTRITLAHGVYVAGYRLLIGDEWVEGRLFDEKTATWLYEKIRRQVAPRDPGLLRVMPSGELDLRVFPVGPREFRATELTLVHPLDIKAPAHLASSRVTTTTAPDSGPKSAASVSWMAFSPGGAIGSIKTDALPPSQPRTPFPLLIFPHTVSAPADSKITSAWNEQWHGTGAAYAANFEVARIESPSAKIAIPARGEFDASRAVLTALNDFASSADLAKNYPVVVLCNATDVTVEDFASTAAGQRLAELSPEAPEIQMHSGPADWRLPNAISARTFRLGEHVVTAATEGAGNRVRLLFPDATSSHQMPLEFLTATGDWVPVQYDQITDPNYLRAIESSFWARERQLHPHRFAGNLGSWLTKAKDLGVLVPGLAFIAAETKSQWITLERKEADRNKQDDAFEIEEMTAAVPEPSTIALLLIAAVYVVYRKRSFVTRLLRARRSPNAVS